ncbi:hypothetical protein [Chryseobacterium balustinum]|uniref:hypothetical protein n=1 Tax=Chryseobacterium balustinum TaxID=246 RepID=UPI003CF3FA95
MIEFRDINGNPITINIKYVVAIYCDSEVILSTGDRIKIDMAYDQLRAIINSALAMSK